MKSLFILVCALASLAAGAVPLPFLLPDASLETNTAPELTMVWLTSIRGTNESAPSNVITLTNDQPCTLEWAMNLQDGCVLHWGDTNLIELASVALSTNTATIWPVPVATIATQNVQLITGPALGQWTATNVIYSSTTTNPATEFFTARLVVFKTNVFNPVFPE